MKTHQNTNHQPPIHAKNPHHEPTANPSADSHQEPTANPSADTHREPANPSADPCHEPTANPSADSHKEPVTNPSADPCHEPTANPYADSHQEPVANPTADPCQEPTANPSADSHQQPVANPTADPCYEPTANPPADPHQEPADPTADPCHEPAAVNPTADSHQESAANPTADPCQDPAANPTADQHQPVANPTTDSCHEPSAESRQEPTAALSSEPSCSVHSDGHEPVSPQSDLPSLPDMPDFDSFFSPPCYSQSNVEGKVDTLFQLMLKVYQEVQEVKTVLGMRRREYDRAQQQPNMVTPAQSGMQSGPQPAGRRSRPHQGQHSASGPQQEVSRQLFRRQPNPVYAAITGDVVMLGRPDSGVTITKEQYEQCCSKANNGQKLVLKLMDVVFSKEEMASSNLSGGHVKCKTGVVYKQKLDEQVIAALTEQAELQFLGCLSEKHLHEAMADAINGKCRHLWKLHNLS